MELNHTIVPSIDKEAFGLRYEGPTGHFAAVQVNDGLTLGFDDAKAFESHHLAFKVTDDGNGK